MKWGNFEISEFVLYAVSVIVLLIVIVVWCEKDDIEQEKTKQLQLQENILMLQREEKNGV